MKRQELFRGWALLGIALAAAGCGRRVSGGFQGYVEAEYVHVAAAESGRLERLAAVKGRTVAAGAPLFALESAREAAALRQAQDQKAAAESLLRDLQSGKRPQELEVVAAQLAQAQAEAQRAEADRQRDEKLFVTDGIAQAQLDHSRAAAETAAARVRELAGQLAVAKLPARAEQTAAQAAQVAAAQAAMEQAEWGLQQKTVAAPVAGLVFDTLYREGEWVAAGMPVVRLLPPGNVKVRFFVPEHELGRLSLGQALAIRCDGRAADIAAAVSYIATEAEYTPPIIYSNETRAKLVFLIEAQPEAGADLHPGQPVQVMIRQAGKRR